MLIRQVTRHKAAPEPTKWFIMDPRTSPLTMRWDIVNAVALIITATITPYEVGFLSAGDVPMFVLNRVIDTVFLFDMLLQFFLAYRVGGAVWEFNPGRIAKNYIFGWFLIDFISVGVSVFDILAFENKGDSATGSWRLELIRGVRALRLAKMIRLLKIRRNHLLQAVRGKAAVARGWDTKFAINYNLVKMGRVVLVLIFVSHWFACVWGLQTTFEEDHSHTWLGAFGYCVLSSSGTNDSYSVPAPNGQLAGPAALSAAPVAWECRSPFSQYVASLYWAVMTITSIGYGDIAASTGNTSEQIVCTCLMLVGGMLWGYIIASLVDVLSRMDPEQAAFTKTMDDLNQFMALHSLPVEMRAKLREYFHQTQHLRLTEKHRSLLGMMSPSLQSEVAWLAHGKSLENVSFLRTAPRQFLAELALLLEACVFAPGELAPTGFLYIVHRGVALYGGRLLTVGKVWGQDIIISDHSLRSDFCGRAMNYIEVYRLSSVQLLELAEQFPTTHKHIRWAAIRMAMQRYLVRSALSARSFKERPSAFQGSCGWNGLSRASRQTEDETARAAVQGQKQRRASIASVGMVATAVATLDTSASHPSLRRSESEPVVVGATPHRLFPPSPGGSGGRLSSRPPTPPPSHGRGVLIGSVREEPDAAAATSLAPRLDTLEGHAHQQQKTLDALAARHEVLHDQQRQLAADVRAIRQLLETSLGGKSSQALPEPDFYDA